MPDGGHLTPVAGMHYVIHLFDQTETALQAATLGAERQLVSIRESVRQQNDRVAYLENRHGSLEKRSNTKMASDAEFDDWMLNRSEEDWLVVTGLPRLSCSQREWQDAARRQVADVIKLVLHANRVQTNFEVCYVSNPFRFQTNRQNLYNVQMDSIRSSKLIRDVFSGFFRGRKPATIPPPLKGVSIRNKITPNTKIRISILHQFGSLYKESNPGGMYKVKGFESRPVLTTIPPQNSGGRMRTYNIIQAVTLLPPTFSDEHLVKIFQVVSEQQPGNLQALFVVLRDDDRDRCLELVRQRRSSQPSQPSGSGVISGTFSGSGSGMGLEGSGSVILDSLRSPPPPPPESAELIESDSRGKKQVRVVHPDEERSSRRQSNSPDHRDEERDKDKDKSKVKDKDRRKEKDKSRSRRKRRHSSSSSDERGKKHSKKSKKSKRHRRSPSSSSSAGSSSDSDSSDSSDSRHEHKKTETRTRDRDRDHSRESSTSRSRDDARSRSRER